MRASSLLKLMSLNTGCPLTPFAPSALQPRRWSGFLVTWRAFISSLLAARFSSSTARRRRRRARAPLTRGGGGGQLPLSLPRTARPTPPARRAPHRARGAAPSPPLLLPLRSPPLPRSPPAPAPARRHRPFEARGSSGGGGGGARQPRASAVSTASSRPGPSAPPSRPGARSCPQGPAPGPTQASAKPTLGSGPLEGRRRRLLVPRPAALRAHQARRPGAPPAAAS